MKYADKLKDPRWQKKRLEIMQRANFQCECCESKVEELQIHHLRYSGNPWEVDSRYLECLCASCHEQRTKFNQILQTLPTREFCVLIAGLRAAQAAFNASDAAH